MGVYYTVSCANGTELRGPKYNVLEWKESTEPSMVYVENKEPYSTSGYDWSMGIYLPTAQLTIERERIIAELVEKEGHRAIGHYVLYGNDVQLCRFLYDKTRGQFAAFVGTTPYVTYQIRVEPGTRTVRYIFTDPRQFVWYDTLKECIRKVYWYLYREGVYDRVDQGFLEREQMEETGGT